MTIYDLKPAFQNLLRPVCRFLANAGVTANQVTVLAVILSLVVGALFAMNPAERWALLLLPVWLFLRMALNAIDGMLAREHNMRSDVGAILNELSDVVADAALYLPFAFIPGFDPRWVVAVVFIAMLTEMAGVLMAQLGASRRYDGPFGKSDRAFAFGVLAVLLAFSNSLDRWATPLLAALAVAGIVTVFNRCSRGLKELRGHETSVQE